MREFINLHLTYSKSKDIYLHRSVLNYEEMILVILSFLAPIYSLSTETTYSQTPNVKIKRKLPASYDDFGRGAS